MRAFLVVSLMAVALALSAEAMIYQPVSQVTALCADTCADLFFVFSQPCARCLENTGQFATWTNNSNPFYSLKRMPFPENNLSHVFAIPLIIPSEDYVERLINGAYNARMEYTTLPKNVTVCYNNGKSCATRNVGPDNILFNSSSPTGFCYTGNAWVHLDPACDGSTDPLQNITWNTPEQLASMFTTNRNQTIYRPIAQAYSRQVLTDPVEAADSIWRMANTAWTQAMYIKTLTEADLPQLQSLFGADWQFTDQLKAGLLAKLDLTWVGRLNYSQDSIPTFQPWPFAVLQQVQKNGRPWFRAIAVRLEDPRKNPQPPAIFTAVKNPYSFLVSLVYVRSALSFHQIWIGHFYTLHISTGASIYSFYNNVDPGVPLMQSKHPLRMLLDPHFDPTLPHGIELWSWNGLNFPAYAAITNPYHPTVFNGFSKEIPSLGVPGTFYNLHPKNLVAFSGLNQSVWSSGNGTGWEYYPQVNFALGTISICEKFVTKVINIYYQSDKDVKADKQIQNWVTSMLDPMGGNLVAISDTNKVTTKQELIELCAFLVHKTVLHNIPRFQDFAFESFFNIPVAATRVDATTLPDPARNYTLDEIMTLLPNMENTAKVLLIAMLAGPVHPPTYQWMEASPDDPNEPNWESKLPFFPVAGKKAKKANAAAVQFRKDILGYYGSYPVDGLLRDIDTTKEWSSWQGFSPNMDF